VGESWGRLYAFLSNRKAGGSFQPVLDLYWFTSVIVTGLAGAPVAGFEFQLGIGVYDEE
jgi:hypothetical protein